MKINKLLDEVLDEIKPDESYKEDIFQKTSEIISKINRNKIRARAVLGGSGAKGTWLKNFDADVFVLFNYKKYNNRSDEISDILHGILKKEFKRISRVHGSRDYFQLTDKNYTFEIIPILDIKNSSQAKNITDISPLHSKWVLRHKKLVNEMKLTKQFAAAQNLYGAESYIRGFSGYVCEILPVYYGSFFKLLKAAAKWQDKVVIDVQKYYRGRDVFKIINTSKLESPLIVIDPVQKDRNAAAALSFEKFTAFKKAAEAFIKYPSKSFFAKKDIEEEIRKKSKGKVFKISIRAHSGKVDVVGSRLQKIFEFISKELGKYGFKILHSAWQLGGKDEARLYFAILEKDLPLKIEVEGPPIKMEQHVRNFKKLHKKTFVKRGRIYAVEKRKFTSPGDFLISLLKNPYVKERSVSSKLEVI